MANLAPLLNAIGGFAGGLANALQQNQGQSDLGNALLSLYGGSGDGSSQPSTSNSGSGSLMPLLMPQQPSSSGQAQPFQGQTNLGLPTATGQPQSGPTLGAGPLAAQVQTQSTQPGTATGGPGGIGSDAVAAQSPPQGQQQPSQGQQVGSPVGATQQATGQPGSPPTGNAATLGRGPLTLPTLVQAIRQRNPNISGRHLAAAVQRALPILSMEGLTQYRGIEQQLRMENEQSMIEDRRERASDRRQSMRDREQYSAERIQMQTQREQDNIKMKLQGLQQAKDLKTAQMNASALRAAIKDKLEATNHQIQMQYGLTDEQKAQLYQQAQQDAKLANDNLDKLLAEKSKGGGEKPSANNKENTQGAQKKPKVSDEQKAAWKKQAQDAIASGGDPTWVKNKYKELTGEDLGD